LAALLRGSQVVSVSQTLRVEQRVPPMFGRATIRLGIGPHSSICIVFCICMYFVTVCACHIEIKGYLLTYLLMQQPRDHKYYGRPINNVLMTSISYSETMLNA